MSMGYSKLYQVLMMYSDLVLRHQGKATPVRLDDAPVEERGTRQAQLNHLTWMADQAVGFVNEAIQADKDGDEKKVGKRMDKAFRWLGFIQGSFWILGIRTIDEMKQDNMPEGETFEKGRI